MLSRLGTKSVEKSQRMDVMSRSKTAIGVRNCNGSVKRAALLQTVVNAKTSHRCAVVCRSPILHIQVTAGSFSLAPYLKQHPVRV